MLPVEPVALLASDEKLNHQKERVIAAAAAAAAAHGAHAHLAAVRVWA
jgi:hypothetical protein